MGMPWKGLGAVRLRNPTDQAHRCLFFLPQLFHENGWLWEPLSVNKPRAMAAISH